MMSATVNAVSMDCFPLSILVPRAADVASRENRGIVGGKFEGGLARLLHAFRDSEWNLGGKALRLTGKN